MPASLSLAWYLTTSPFALHPFVVSRLDAELFNGWRSSISSWYGRKKMGAGAPPPLISVIERISSKFFEMMIEMGGISRLFSFFRNFLDVNFEMLRLGLISQALRS